MKKLSSEEKGFFIVLSFVCGMMLEANESPWGVAGAEPRPARIPGREIDRQ